MCFSCSSCLTQRNQLFIYLIFSVCAEGCQVLWTWRHVVYLQLICLDHRVCWTLIDSVIGRAERAPGGPIDSKYCWSVPERVSSWKLQDCFLLVHLHRCQHPVKQEDWRLKYVLTLWLLCLITSNWFENFTALIVLIEYFVDTWKAKYGSDAF